MRPSQKRANMKYIENNPEHYRAIVRKSVKKHYDNNREHILIYKSGVYRYKCEFRRLSAIFDSYE
jgi:hypothetical protein